MPPFILNNYCMYSFNGYFVLFYTELFFFFSFWFHNQNPKRIFHSQKTICAWLFAAWINFVSCVAISYSYCRDCHYFRKARHWTISKHSETSAITKNFYVGKKYGSVPSVYHQLLNPVHLVAGCMQMLKGTRERMGLCLVEDLLWIHATCQT